MTPVVNERGEIVGADQPQRGSNISSSQVDQIHPTLNMRQAAFKSRMTEFKRTTMIISGIIYGVVGAIAGADIMADSSGTLIGLLLGAALGLGATAYYNKNEARKYEGTDYVFSLLMPGGVIIAAFFGAGILFLILHIVARILVFVLILFIIYIVGSIIGSMFEG